MSTSPPSGSPDDPLNQDPQRPRPRPRPSPLPENSCEFSLDPNGDYQVVACNCSEGYHSPLPPPGGAGSPPTKYLPCEPD